MTKETLSEDEHEEQTCHTDVNLTKRILKEEVVREVDQHVHKHPKSRKDTRGSRSDIGIGLRRRVVTNRASSRRGNGENSGSGNCSQRRYMRLNFSLKCSCERSVGVPHGYDSMVVDQLIPSTGKGGSRRKCMKLLAP